MQSGSLDRTWKEAWKVLEVERGRLRKVEARELGVVEGILAEHRDLGGDHERAPKVDARELGALEGGAADRRDRGGDHERAPKVSAKKGAVPDLHQRGGGTDRRDCGGDHERARKVGGIEGAVLDLHERGRLREVEARKLGGFEGEGADGLDGRAHLERAREVRVALQEVSWDVRHGRVGELPARLRTARSDGTPLHPRHRGKGDDQGNAVVGGRRGNDWRLGVGGRVLDVGWGLERRGDKHALEAGARIGGEAGAHGWDSGTEPGLLEDEDGQGGAYEVAAHGEAEQASQTEQRLAVGAHLAFGVLQGLVLVRTEVHDDRTNSAVVAEHDGKPR
eukprot:scaffold8721_cov80-Phaeocystis_antarctica.AAC.20